MHRHGGSGASIGYKPAREDMRDLVAVCKADFDKLRAAATEQVEANRRARATRPYTRGLHKPPWRRIFFLPTVSAQKAGTLLRWQAWG